MGTAVSCPAIDFRSFPRPQDGDHNGTSVCDMGAFESTPLALTGSVTSTNHLSLNWTQTAHPQYELYQSDQPYAGYVLVGTQTTGTATVNIGTIGLQFYRVFGVWNGQTAEQSQTIGHFTFTLSGSN